MHDKSWFGCFFYVPIRHGVCFVLLDLGVLCQDKIFVGCGQSIHGFTRKGKEFVSLSERLGIEQKPFVHMCQHFPTKKATLIPTTWAAASTFLCFWPLVKEGLEAEKLKG